MDSPYKGLVPYAEEDFEYFFGRETEQRIISANLRASRLTLLYGESGVGKSSLLNAGVTHELRQDPDFVAVVFSTWQVDPIVGIKQALNAASPLRKVLEDTARNAMEVFKADNVTIYQFHPETASFGARPVTAGLFLDPDSMRRGGGPDDPMLGLIARRSVTLVEDENSSPMHLWRRFVTREEVKSSAIVPLTAGATGEPVALMFVNFLRSHRFSAEDSEAVDVLCASATTAIQTALPHERLSEVHPAVSKLRNLLDAMPYPDFAVALRSWRNDLHRDERCTLLLILDQFEDFFQYHSSESANPRSDGAQSFAEQLPHMIAAEDLPVNFLISIREDLLSGLDRFKASIPNLFNNYLRVEHLSVPGAKEAILKPLSHFNRLHPDRAIYMTDEKLADLVVRQIVHAQDDGGERVQAASLQLVMNQWWAAETENRSKEMSEVTLAALGEARNIVTVYFDEALAKLAQEDGGNTEICFHLIDKLVTSAGRRTVQTLEELTDGVDDGSDRVKAVLENLVAARVLTPVPAPKGALPGERSFEFAHDLMAKAATRRLQEYKERKAQREDDEARSRAETVARLQLSMEELKGGLRQTVFERAAVLGVPKQSADWPDVLVLMPFVSDLQPVYNDHIKGVAATLGVRVFRTDDLFSSGPVIKDIWSAIHAARVVIADCTGRNPNVFYEIGLAHAIGRNTILISQTLDDLPFDLRHLRIIIYQYTPRGMIQFEQALTKAIKESM